MRISRPTEFPKNNETRLVYVDRNFLHGGSSCGNFGGIPWGCHGHWLGDGVALEPACHLARASVTALGAFQVGTNELFGEDPSVV